MGAEQPPEPTELVYVPEPSWTPAIAALGLLLVVVGLFAGLVYTIIGAVIALLALRSWIADTRKSLSRLPGEQNPATAVLPAVPPRRKPRA